MRLTAAYQDVSMSLVPAMTYLSILIRMLLFPLPYVKSYTSYHFFVFKS